MCKFCVGMCFHLSWILTSEWNYWAYMVVLCLTFWELPNCFLMGLRHFTYLPTLYYYFLFIWVMFITQHACQLLIFSALFIAAILVDMECYPILVLICISLVINDIEHFFVCAYWPFVYFLWSISSGLLSIFYWVYLYIIKL